MQDIVVLAPDSQAPALAAGLLPDALEPFRQVGTVAAEIVADLSFRHRVIHLYERGPRVVAEFLAELCVERLIATVIDQMLHRFLTVPDEALDATGAHDSAPAPLHGVTE